MRGRISTSMLGLAARGTHETGVAGFADPLSRHAQGASVVGGRALERPCIICQKRVGISLFRGAQRLQTAVAGV
jgi:hypothetical protein